MASFQAALQGAIGDTEKEILDFAFDREPSDNNNDRISADNGDELIAYGSQVEGIDGAPVSDDEIAAAAMQGEVPGYLGDRPLAYQEELAVTRENAQLRAQIQQRDAAIAEWRARFDPEIQAQAELNRAAAWDQVGAVPIDDARANNFGAYVNGLEQQNLQFRMQSSEARAIQEYGQETFDQAIEQVKQNYNSPRAQEILHKVRNSVDPAQTLMEEVHGPDVVKPRWDPPFARRRDHDAEQRPTRWPSQNEDQENLNSGYGDKNVEELIWRDTWK